MRNTEDWRTDFQSFFFWMWAVFNFQVRMPINPVNKGKNEKAKEKTAWKLLVNLLIFFWKKSSEISNRSGLQTIEKLEKFLHPIMNKRKKGLTLLLFYSPKASRQRCRNNGEVHVSLCLSLNVDSNA